MERLVHGLRVPYSFEYDPFGQLWLLSNGEGNPDRFVRVIEGVDYHCYSRPGVDNNWLAGKHPLAPPCLRSPRRRPHPAHALLRGRISRRNIRASSSADNWGRHGFAGANRGIFRFVPDERNNIVKKETLVACTDPHFRPATSISTSDGNLLIADWYGRDDESDMTGRIWRVEVHRQDRPEVKHKLDSAEWSEGRLRLGRPWFAASPDPRKGNEHADRPRQYRGEKTLGSRSRCEAPLGAANALWALLRIGTPESQSAIAAAATPTGMFAVSQ